MGRDEDAESSMENRIILGHMLETRPTEGLITTSARATIFLVLPPPWQCLKTLRARHFAHWELTSWHAHW